MSKLSGVIPAIPTPLLENEDLDVESLHKLINYAIGQGVSGIFVLGNMGEGTALLDSVKLATVETAARYINGRVPLMAACSDGSTRRTIELGKKIQDSGADYLVSTTPYYYSFPHQQCIIDYFDKVSNALDKPLLFYNNPGSTGNKINSDTLEVILNMDNVAGVKDSSGDIHIAMDILRKYPDKDNRPFSFLYGDETVYDIILLLGADGIVTGGGTCFLDILVKLYEAATAGDKAKAFELQKQFWTEMKEMLGSDLIIDWMAAIKTNLKNKGLCENYCTHPFINRMITN